MTLLRERFKTIEKYHSCSTSLYKTKIW